MRDVSRDEDLGCPSKEGSEVLQGEGRNLGSLEGVLWSCSLPRMNFVPASAAIFPHIYLYCSKNRGRIGVCYPNLLLSAPREPCRLIVGRKTRNPEGSWPFPSSASVPSCPMLSSGMGDPTKLSFLPLPSPQPQGKNQESQAKFKQTMRKIPIIHPELWEG